MSLGVRKGLVMSRWDPRDQLACGFSPTLSVSSKTTGVERMPSCWYRVDVSWKVRLTVSYLASGLSRGRRWAWACTSRWPSAASCGKNPCRKKYSKRAPVLLTTRESCFRSAHHTTQRSTERATKRVTLGAVRLGFFSVYNEHASCDITKTHTSGQWFSTSVAACHGRGPL